MPFFQKALFNGVCDFLRMTHSNESAHYDAVAILHERGRFTWCYDFCHADTLLLILEDFIFDFIQEAVHSICLVFASEASGKIFDFFFDSIVDASL